MKRLSSLAKVVVGLLVLLCFGSLTAAQETTTSNMNTAVYTNRDRTFYLPVLETGGWSNNSTTNYAHFRHTDRGVDLYALSVNTTDISQGIAQAVAAVEGSLPAEPTATGSVTISGDEWTQNTYTLADGRSLVTTGLVKNNLTFMVLLQGEPDALRSINETFMQTLDGFRLTPATSPYLVLGLVVAGIIVFGFLLSLVLRYQSFQKDLAVIKELREENNA